MYFVTVNASVTFMIFLSSIAFAEDIQTETQPQLEQEHLDYDNSRVEPSHCKHIHVFFS